MQRYWYLEADVAAQAADLVSVAALMWMWHSVSTACFAVIADKPAA